MKEILSVDEYKVSLIHASIFIFSSYKSCHPCRLLKKWVMAEYPEVEGIYYVDVDNPKLSSITDEIYALPTVVLYKEGKVVHQVEGFQQEEISEMIYQLQKPSEETTETTSLETFETFETSIELETPLETPNVDKVLEELNEKLKNY